MNNRFLWPREHGGWSMLGTACIVGAAAAHGAVGAWAAIIVAFALFMIREPLYAVLHGHSAWQQVIGTALLATIPGLYLVVIYPTWWLVAAAGFALGSTYWYMRLRLDHQERRMGGEFIGIVQLSTAAPLVYLLGGGSDGTKAFLLWLLVFAYYAGSIYYVKMRKQQSRTQPSSRKNANYGEANLAYQIAVAVLLGLLVSLKLVPLWLVSGFLPNIVKSIVHTFVPPRRLDIKRLGLQEMAYAGVVTLVLAVWAALG